MKVRRNEVGNFFTSTPHSLQNGVQTWSQFISTAIKERSTEQSLQASLHEFILFKGNLLQTTFSDESCKKIMSLEEIAAELTQQRLHRGFSYLKETKKSDLKESNQNNATKTTENLVTNQTSHPFVDWCSPFSKASQMHNYIKSFLLLKGFSGTLQSFQKESRKRDMDLFGAQDDISSCNLLKNKICLSVLHVLDSAYSNRILDDIFLDITCWKLNDFFSIPDAGLTEPRWGDPKNSVVKEKFTYLCQRYQYINSSQLTQGSYSDSRRRETLKDDSLPHYFPMVVQDATTTFLWINDRSLLLSQVSDPINSVYFFWCRRTHIKTDEVPSTLSQQTPSDLEQPLNLVLSSDVKADRQRLCLGSDETTDTSLRRKNQREQNLPRLTLSGLYMIEEGSSFLSLGERKSIKTNQGFLYSLLTGTLKRERCHITTPFNKEEYGELTWREILTLHSVAQLRYELCELIRSGFTLLVIEFFRLFFPSCFVESPLPNAIVLLLAHHTVEIMYSPHLSTDPIEEQGTVTSLVRLAQIFENQRHLWILSESHKSDIHYDEVPQSLESWKIGSEKQQKDRIALWWLRNVLQPLRSQLDALGQFEFLKACQVFHEPHVPQYIPMRRKTIARAVDQYLLEYHFGISFYSPLEIVIRQYGFVRSLLKKRENLGGPLMTPKSILYHNRNFLLKEILSQPSVTLSLSRKFSDVFSAVPDSSQGCCSGSEVLHID